ncbi:uncharacterized protein TNCV_3656111 [Trichonephila clavipes]|nr:uncharacterized protein TNCV_3656111 [Trichonephila clavipes]
MSNSKVRKWIWKFKDVRTIVHNEEGSGRPSVITDDLKQAFETKILWVPRLLTMEHKDKMFVSSLEFLIRYEEVGDDKLI